MLAYALVFERLSHRLLGSTILKRGAINFHAFLFEEQAQSLTVRELSITPMLDLDVVGDQIVLIADTRGVLCRLRNRP